MKIYKLTDKIKLRIDDIEVTISPLSTVQKAEIQGLMMQSFNNPENLLPSMQATNLCVKYGVKDIKGVKGLEYENGILTDDSVEMLGNCKLSTKLSQCCLNLIHGIPEVFKTELGDKIKGVEIVKKAPVKKKKSAKTS